MANPKPALTVIRNDSFASLASGLGDVNRDKRTAAFAFYQDYPVDEMEELYAQDGLAGQICDAKPEDMLSKGYDFNFPGEKSSSESSDELKNELDELGLDACAIEALAMSRCCGGAVILMGVNDGLADPSAPLAEARIKEVEWLSVLTRGAIKPYRTYTDVRSPKYGEVEIYEISNQDAASAIVTPFGEPANRVTKLGQLIHESRLVRVDGIRIPKRLRRDRQGWGGAILERCYSVVRDYDMSWGSISLLMQELGMMHLSVKNLATQVNAGNNAAVIGRAQQIAYAKSTARAIVTDAEEKVDRVNINWTGVPEVMQQAAVRVSSVARTPVSRLMGTSAAGLNATGEGDRINWYDYLRAGQRYETTPIIARVAKLVMLGQGAEPERWWVEWRDLESMSETEQADIQLKLSQAHRNWVETGVLFPEEVAESTWGGEKFSMDIHLDNKTRKALDASDDVANPDAVVAGADPQADPQAVDPQTALNGAQVASMVDIVTKVATGDLPRETGIEILISAFPIDRPQAEKIMGAVGNGFSIEKPDPPPAFGGAGNTEPPPPPPKPNAEK